MTAARRTTYATLERTLTRDKTAILDEAGIQLLAREVRRLFESSVAGLAGDAIDRTDDTIRWRSLDARCQQVRSERGLGLRDVAAALRIPQYRLRAIERGWLNEFRPDVARRYFRFLEIDDWVGRWCRANRELAGRAGLRDEPAFRTRRTRSRPDRG